MVSHTFPIPSAIDYTGDLVGNGSSFDWVGGLMNTLQNWTKMECSIFFAASLIATLSEYCITYSLQTSRSKKTYEQSWQLLKNTSNHVATRFSRGICLTSRLRKLVKVSMLTWFDCGVWHRHVRSRSVVMRKYNDPIPPDAWNFRHCRSRSDIRRNIYRPRQDDLRCKMVTASTLVLNQDNSRLQLLRLETDQSLKSTPHYCIKQPQHGNCPAYGQRYSNCFKNNHFSSVFTSGRRINQVKKE